MVLGQVSASPENFFDSPFSPALAQTKQKSPIYLFIQQIIVEHVIFSKNLANAVDSKDQVQYHKVRITVTLICFCPLNRLTPCYFRKDSLKQRSKIHKI